MHTLIFDLVARQVAALQFAHDIGMARCCPVLVRASVPSRSKQASFQCIANGSLEMSEQFGHVELVHVPLADSQRGHAYAFRYEAALFV